MKKDMRFAALPVALLSIIVGRVMHSASIAD